MNNVSLATSSIEVAVVDSVPLGLISGPHVPRLSKTGIQIP